MPDASTPDPEVEPQAASATNVSGGVNVDANQVTIGGDVVGRDKIVGYTVEQVSALLTQIDSTFQPKPFDGRCPYLGLDAFTEDDADRFFGRETLVNELLVRVKESRFVVIAGPSGSGKSSLVRAGLIYALKQGAIPNSDRWLYATLTPGRDPIESLALAMSRIE
jgi:ABC-type multidrug transport system fused ATPase/permease subunit